MTDIAKKAESIVSDLLQLGEDKLFRELALRQRVIQDYPELKDELEPEFAETQVPGIQDAYQEVIHKFMDRVNRDAYTLICTGDDNFKDLRAMFKDAPGKFTAALAVSLIGTGLVPAAIATVVAALIAKLILPNAQGTLCEVWGERLPKEPVALQNQAAKRFRLGGVDAMSGVIRFKTHFASTEFSSVSLPVEVRTLDFALVEQGVSDQAIKVSPGTYVVTARLPAGQKLMSQPVTVGNNSEVMVDLAPRPEDRTPNESLEVRHFLSSAIKNNPNVTRSEAETSPISFSSSFFAAEQSEPDISQRPQLGLQIFIGNGLSEPFKLLPGYTPETYSTPDGLRFPINLRWGEELGLLQITYPDGIRLNVRLPIFQGVGRQPSNDRHLFTFVAQCQVFAQGPNYLPDMHLQHTQADTLMHYFSQGQLDQANTVINRLSSIVVKEYDPPNPTALSAENLLREKVGDPIAAAVGAYALLRFGELDRLHNWTANLMNWFSWLPDGLIIRAEHLARVGQHEEAYKLFRQLPERGLPIFTVGLTYALDRLRSYIHSKQHDDLSALLEVLQTYARTADLSKPVLTFSSQNPDPTTGTFQVIITVLNIRAQPNRSTPPIGTLKQGDRVEVRGSYSGDGYIFAKLLSVNGQAQLGTAYIARQFLGPDK